MKKLAYLCLISSTILISAFRGAAPIATAALSTAAAATPTPVEETRQEPAAEVVVTEEAVEERAAVGTPSETADKEEKSPEEELAHLAALAPPPQLSDRELGIHIVPCLPGISAGAAFVEGDDYTCGLFTVPQNWDNPDGRNLDLGYVQIYAAGDNPDPDPILFLVGGPGTSAVFGLNMKPYQDLRADRDIIFYDIRGAGVSQRIGFAECLVLALQNGAPTKQVEALWAPNAQLWAEIRSDRPGPEELKPWEVDFPLLNEICGDQFTGQGLDLNQFSTASNARDAVELINALGYESFNIHGTSYGTRHAMATMDLLSKTEGGPSLRAVVLDSTFPPSVYLLRTIVRSHHDFMVQLLEECQADAACAQAYPNLKERLAALLDGLEEEPISASGETITLADVVAELTNVTGSRAGYLPKTIAELERGELETYLALRDGTIGIDAVEAAPLLELDTRDPVQAFIADALDLLSGDAALEFAFYVNIALAQEERLAMLQSIIEETYTGETGAQMLSMLEALTAEDFAQSPYVLQLLANAAVETDPVLQLARVRRGVTGSIPRPLYSSIHCIDDILHERFEDAVNSYNDLLFPQLTDLVESQAQAGRCENWPVAAAPIEVKNPVSSDVPTLVLQGTYDGPTPVYMGRRAARELENSTFVLVPQQGHGTWNLADDCVGRIAGAFILDPGAELDTSCLDLRRPQWSLPEERTLTSGELTPEQMMNATYSGLYDEPVTLTDGLFEGEPFVEGGVSRPVVTYIGSTLTQGDLDGDGLDDAVVLLIENSGGSGTFAYVGAQLNHGGRPIDAGAALLGDRVQLLSMQVADGQVIAEIVTQGTDEGLCCGTLKVRKSLGMQNGQLVEMASEELSRVSLDDLMGTQWLLERLNYGQEPIANVTISAEFAEGLVSGSGGCNDYRADVTSDGDQLLAVGPVVVTGRACSDELDALEADYLAALQNATEWRIFPGQLAIDYTDAAGDQGTLFFNPAGSQGADKASE